VCVNIKGNKVSRDSVGNAHLIWVHMLLLLKKTHLKYETKLNKNARGHLEILCAHDEVSLN
jgi:hypothetical protein